MIDPVEISIALFLKMAEVGSRSILNMMILQKNWIA